MEGNETSVHLSQFPVANLEAIDEELQERTHLAQRATSLLFSLRKQANLKVRQPLQKVMIPAGDETTKERLNAIAELLKHEVNVKEVQIISNDEAADILVKEVKPNFKSLGPKFGKEMKAVAQAISQMSHADIQQLERNAEFEIEVDGQKHLLPMNDFEVKTKDIQGWVVANDGNLTVALDTELNENLILEGISRELVNRIQNIRKESGLEVTDRIQVFIEPNEKLQKTVEKNKEYICEETLTDEIEFKNINVGNSIEIDDIGVKISIEKK